MFISKLYESLAAFQQTLLDLFPPSEPFGLRLVSSDMVHPDPTALRDDLNHAKSLIEHDPNKPMFGCLRQFLTGVAKSVGDAHLERVAQNKPIENLGLIRKFAKSVFFNDLALDLTAQEPDALNCEGFLFVDHVCRS